MYLRNDLKLEEKLEIDAREEMQIELANKHKYNSNDRLDFLCKKYESQNIKKQLIDRFKELYK